MDQQQQQQPETAVFVGNLAYASTEDSIRNLFGSVGAIQRVKVLVFSDTQRPKGAAIVTFEEASAAAQAVDQLQGASLDGRQISLRPFYTNGPPQREGGFRGESRGGRGGDFGGRGGFRGGRGGDFGGRGGDFGGRGAGRAPAPAGAGVVVTVGNLPFRSTWRDIKDVFNQVAPVLRADITSRGSGSVSFATMDEAMAVVKDLQGADLGGRPMSLRIARE
jgi:RNA recognition motif-containing protein